MSSVKMEVHNVSQRHQRRTKPWSWLTCTKIDEVRPRGFQAVSGQTDRQTDMLITILHTPRRSKVKMHGSYQTFCTVSMRTLTFAVTSGFCVEAAILLFTAVTLLLIASAARYVSNPPLPTSYIQWLLIKRNILTTNTAKIFQNTLPTDSVLMPSVL